MWRSLNARANSPLIPVHIMRLPIPEHTLSKGHLIPDHITNIRHLIPNHTTRI